LESFNKALAINPADPDAWSNRGTVFNDLARYEEAIADFDKAISLKADHAGAFCNKANSLSVLGCHEEALAAYERALELRSGLVEAWLGRAKTLSWLGRDAEALAAFDEVLARQPVLAEALLGRANSLYRLGRHAEAAVAYDRVLAENSNLVEAWLGRGNACFQLKRNGEALAAFDQALACKPDLTEALLGRGGILYLAGRFEDAVAAFDRALAIEPGFAGAWLNRGKALQGMKRLEEAIASYRQALATGGDADFIRYILASLGVEAVPAAAPRRHMVEWFDCAADEFDQYMVGTLKYQMHELLSEALARFLPEHKVDVLDLGCGTGLLGQRLRSRAATLIGVDLSANMIEHARRRDIYHDLICAELNEFLPGQSGRFDLVAATDVFIYIGDLAPVFCGVHAALREGGLFGFSVEANEDADFTLRATQRYAHSSRYLRALAGQHGFTVETIEPGVIRKEYGIDVAGYLAVLRRHRSPSSVPAATAAVSGMI
jgi:predicted TPR repeat methyltransferase